jgi:hypothetical protein
MPVTQENHIQRSEADHIIESVRQNGQAALTREYVRHLALTEPNILNRLQRLASDCGFELTNGPDHLVIEDPRRRFIARSNGRLVTPEEQREQERRRLVHELELERARNREAQTPEAQPQASELEAVHERQLRRMRDELMYARRALEEERRQREQQAAAAEAERRAAALSRGSALYQREPIIRRYEQARVLCDQRQQPLPLIVQNEAELLELPILTNVAVGSIAFQNDSGAVWVYTGGTGGDAWINITATLPTAPELQIQVVRRGEDQIMQAIEQLRSLQDIARRKPAFAKTPEPQPAGKRSINLNEDV